MMDDGSWIMDDGACMMDGGRYSIDDIHYMRKTANIKKVSTPHSPKLTQAIEQKKLGLLLHIYYPELAKTISYYLSKIPVKIDIYI